jgi:cysteinyl-tRNA synthetase
MFLYNDLTHKKEKFIPLKDSEVTFYSCGPTVYDFFHIGNARPFIVFDVLRRWLEKCGFIVKYVQNFTDIDDKMITRANSEGITVSELAGKFISEYYEDADALFIRRPTLSPKATEHIPEIIELIEKIIKNGHAYVVDGDVYFNVQSWNKYGKLTTQTQEELLSGARVEIDERKRHPLDFALWKAQKPGEPAWESPWGIGRPGWHIECSAMAKKHLGDTIDIHTGGVDLSFPHHENEIAQSESANGKPFVRYWLHNGFLLIDKEKMSKSLDNFLTARAAREKFPPLAIRLFMLSAHYRSPINFAPDGLEQAMNGIERLNNCWDNLHFAEKHLAENSSDELEFVQKISDFEAKYCESMNDDFNTAAAIGVVFEAVRVINTRLQEDALSRAIFDSANKFLSDVNDVMGIFNVGDLKNIDVSAIEALINERNDARKDKNFTRSDEIRNSLSEIGIILEDTPNGTKWKYTAKEQRT